MKVSKPMGTTHGVNSYVNHFQNGSPEEYYAPQVFQGPTGVKLESFGNANHTPLPPQDQASIVNPMQKLMQVDALIDTAKQLKDVMIHEMGSGFSFSNSVALNCVKRRLEFQLKQITGLGGISDIVINSCTIRRETFDDAKNQNVLVKIADILFQDLFGEKEKLTCTVGSRLNKKTGYKPPQLDPTKLGALYEAVAWVLYHKHSYLNLPFKPLSDQDKSTVKNHLSQRLNQCKQRLPKEARVKNTLKRLEKGKREKA